MSDKPTRRWVGAIAASIVTLASLVPTARAQQCDCSQHVGQCSARVTLQGQHLNFSASTNQCAQITYSVNGEPSSITIAGGAGSTEYLITNFDRKPRLSVDSCSVCRVAGEAPQQKKVYIDKACAKSCTAAAWSQGDGCVSGVRNDAQFSACMNGLKQSLIECGSRCRRSR